MDNKDWMRQIANRFNETSRAKQAETDAEAERMKVVERVAPKMFREVRDEIRATVGEFHETIGTNVFSVVDTEDGLIVTSPEVTNSSVTITFADRSGVIQCAYELRQPRKPGFQFPGGDFSKEQRLFKIHVDDGRTVIRWERMEVARSELIRHILEPLFQTVAPF